MDKENCYMYLLNLYTNYLADKQSGFLDGHVSYKGKVLGSMEMLLIVLGIILPGQPYEYQKLERILKLFWFWKIKYESEEHFEEYIVRKVEETLDENGFERNR